MVERLHGFQSERATRTVRANEALAFELLPWGQRRAVLLLTRWLRKHPIVPRALRRYRKLDADLLGKLKAKRH